MRSRRRPGVLVLALLVPALVLAGAAPALAAVDSASDGFGRTVANGFGTADSGGTWTPAGTASRFSVASGAAAIATPAGAQNSAYLLGTAIRDADVTAAVALSALPVGSSAYAGVLARRSSASEYTGRVIVAPSGAISINVLAGATSLKSAVVPGVAATPGATLRIRLQTMGVNPTTVQARLWRSGTTEPSTWQVVATDSSAALQVAGAVGVRTYLSSGATNGPLTSTFDDFAARPIAPPDAPPTARFTVTTTGLDLTADGSGSSDAEGPIATYAWSFGDGATASGALAAHTYAADGQYTVVLTVTDASGRTDTTSRAVSVATANLPPSASFTLDAAGLAATVDASTSTDSDGSVVGYAWSFGDGATATGAAASHTFAAAGSYTITLVVTDDRGATATTSRQATVAPLNAPPVVVVLEQQNALTVNLWGDRSSDPDGTITGYAWSFGDGKAGTGASLSHTYATSGTYTVTLTVTDDRGATAAASRAVTVFASGVRPSQAQWLVDVGNAIEGGTAYLDGHVSGAKPAIVLDIDNTALQSYYQPSTATPPVLAFAQRAVADGYTILVATGRSPDGGSTLRQLVNLGYPVASLCFKDPNATTQASKTACRAAWAAQGYSIIANVGNHTGDLLGGNSGRQYLLPNYAFLD
jgi:PKD repeat protein